MVGDTLSTQEAGLVIPNDAKRPRRRQGGGGEAGDGHRAPGHVTAGRGITIEAVDANQQVGSAHAVNEIGAGPPFITASSESEHSSVVSLTPPWGDLAESPERSNLLSVAFSGVYMPASAIGLMRGLGDQLTDVDDVFLDIVGYTRADFEGGTMNWRAMTPPEFVALDEAGIAQATRGERGGFTLPYQKEFFRKDGSRVPVLLCGAFVPDEPPGTWMGYVVDLNTALPQHMQPGDAQVSLRTVDPSNFYRRFIAELVRERTRLLAIFDSTTNMMWSVDRELRLTAANDAFRSRVSAAIGRPLTIGEQAIAPEYSADVRDEWTGWYREVLKGMPLVTHTRYDYGGRTVAFAHVLTPYRNAGGEVVGVAGVSHDVTAQMVAEEQLDRQRRELVEAQRMARVGSWDWDRASDTVTWSASLRELFGWAPNVPVPSFAQQAALYTPESWERLQRAAAVTIEMGRAYELELELCVPGPARWIVARGEARYDAMGAFIGIHGVVMDVTERHEAEQTRLRLESQLLQSQKMQALGQLAGGVAHDFNNILTSILLQLGTLRDEVGDQPDVATSIEEVDHAARRASALTQQLLMFSRRQAPDLRRVDLNGVVHDFSRMLQRLLGEQYTLDCAPGSAPASVQGDRGMLEQVLMNLVLNARDAMKPGGRIQVRTRCRRITAADLPAHTPTQMTPGRYVELSVADSGCGIPSEMQNRVFEPFFTTKPAGSGTGLGLATVYGIVAQHGGWLEFTSQPERGTTFRVLLPECQREESGQGHGSGTPARTTAGAAGGLTRVLLVEDEAALRALIERTLRQHGYEVVAVGSVEAAESVWSGPGSFDVVLSDVVLTGARTGIDLVRQLRDRDAALGAMLMTGSTEEMGTPGFEGRMGAPVLHKPFDVATLLDAVSSVLSPR